MLEDRGEDDPAARVAEARLVGVDREEPGGTSTTSIVATAGRLENVTRLKRERPGVTGSSWCKKSSLPSAVKELFAQSRSGVLPAITVTVWGLVR